MNIREIFHVWANRQKSAGRSGSVFFDQDTIYSYGHHYPIATFRTLQDGSVVALVNSASNSPTTNKHVSYARQSIHSVPQHQLDVKHWARIVDQATLDAAIKAEAEDDVKAAAAAKQYRREVAAANRERKKEALRTWEENLVIWKAGGKKPALVDLHPVALRVHEGRVETTKGAQVPVAAAVRAWPLIKAGQSDPEFSWGNYTGLSIAEGQLHIGCHHIPLAEIEFIAAALGLAA